MKDNPNSTETGKLAVASGHLRSAQTWRPATPTGAEKLLRWSTSDFQNQHFKIELYRFLADSIPSVSACLWTWARLVAAPGKFIVSGDSQAVRAAQEILDRLATGIYSNQLGNRVGFDVMLSDIVLTLIRDGSIGGFLLVNSDHSGVDQFVPVDPIRFLREQTENGPQLFLDGGERRIDLNRPDFYFIPFGNASNEPFGRSILKPIPFVSYIEQQLVDDMRRTSHNSGYHRLHVKITPPERIAGESDSAYTDRTNEYFDATVKMIKSCEVDDNPVTWNNVEIDYIGPGKSREVTNSWFMTHRAMIEEVCAGTNLAPYLLGYSYGSTTSWAEFKFDIVMRQVRSIQSDISSLIEWIGNVHLGLGGFDITCRWEFDNTFSYRAREESAVKSDRVNNLLRMYEAGLIERDDASRRARSLL